MSRAKSKTTRFSFSLAFQASFFFQMSHICNVEGTFLIVERESMNWTGPKAAAKVRALAKDCASGKSKQRAGGKREEEEHYEEKIWGVFRHLSDGACRNRSASGPVAGSYGSERRGGCEGARHDERVGGASRIEPCRSGPPGRGVGKRIGGIAHRTGV